MKRYCVIGNPIDHSLSPKLHNFWFKKNNIEANYEKKLLEEKEIPKLIESIRKSEISGVNVTVPFKNLIIPFLDSLSSEAEKTNGYASITKLPDPILIKPNFCCKAPKTKLNIRPIVIPKRIFKMLLMKKIN